MSPRGLGDTVSVPHVPELMAFVPTASPHCPGAGRRPNPSPGFEPDAGEISPSPGRRACLISPSALIAATAPREGKVQAGGEAGGTPQGPPTLQGEVVLAAPGGEGERWRGA